MPCRGVETDVAAVVRAAGLLERNVLPVRDRDDARTLFARKGYGTMCAGDHSVGRGPPLACAPVSPRWGDTGRPRLSAIQRVPLTHTFLPSRRKTF